MTPAPSGSGAESRAAERPHPPGASEWWHECWSLDFATLDGIGGFVRLTLFPSLGRAWWWAYVLDPRHGLVVVRDHEVVPPRRASLEIRADALWAELVCETPMEHWGIGMEAFGVRLDDPLDALHGEVGTRLAVGLDLEWELTAPAAYERAGYTQPGRVHGDVLIGTDRIAIDGFGFREHTWGDRAWWTHDAHRVVLGLPDTVLSATVSHRDGGSDGDGSEDDRPEARGWLWRADVVHPVVATLEPRIGVDGLPTGERVTATDLGLGLDLDVDVDVRGVAVVPIELDGSAVAGLVRALCTVEGSDGSRGTGWAEWCRPGRPSERPLGGSG